MPSFSRATAAMRCIFAACAISMSEGILSFARGGLRKTGILGSSPACGLDYGQERPCKRKRRRVSPAASVYCEPVRSSLGLYSPCALLALIARRHLVVGPHHVRHRGADE